VITAALIGAALGFAVAWYGRGRRDRCCDAIPVARRGQPVRQLSLDAARPNRRR
jgi:hypothetical protein